MLVTSTFYCFHNRLSVASLQARSTRIQARSTWIFLQAEMVHALISTLRVLNNCNGSFQLVNHPENCIIIEHYYGQNIGNKEVDSEDQRSDRRKKKNLIGSSGVWVKSVEKGRMVWK